MVTCVSMLKMFCLVFFAVKVCCICFGFPLSGELSPLGDGGVVPGFLRIFLSPSVSPSARQLPHQREPERLWYGMRDFGI